MALAWWGASHLRLGAWACCTTCGISS